MSKRILYLSFYFEPDLCAGSFRNSPLVKELANQAKEKNASIEVFTTLPNRYSTFQSEAPEFEERDNYRIHRIAIPKHKSGMRDQINSFKTYFNAVKKHTRGQKYDLVVASSSRLFTAYLGYSIAKKNNTPLYLDIRDIFTDTMEDVLKSSVAKPGILAVLKFIERKVFNYATHINLISEGFTPYFKKFRSPGYSFYSNGIDEEFLNIPSATRPQNSIKKIVYAGNIGEGQGLHKIVPQAAKKLGDAYRFLIVGDGGAKAKLLSEMERLKTNNIQILPPQNRSDLLDLYQDSDFMFIHLNDYDAFKKVLPSKIFELGAYNKPIVAGVAGYAHEFIEKNIPNKILFPPGDSESMVRQLSSYAYTQEERVNFKEKFRRTAINKEMSKSILTYL
ncbi:glycosyltransferase family 4 protein [Niabella sp.]|uniref:glycosyltransferase family 4 protein n=1 Tax=Niabella sp. TaxID=1962976 RepID=UPI002629B9A6|nr:glycosyltransferase family 4 protein [Niabella sp.]